MSSVLIQSQSGAFALKCTSKSTCTFEHMHAGCWMDCTSAFARNRYHNLQITCRLSMFSYFLNSFWCIVTAIYFPAIAIAPLPSPTITTNHAHVYVCVSVNALWPRKVSLYEKSLFSPSSYSHKYVYNLGWFATQHHKNTTTRWAFDL